MLVTWTPVALQSYEAVIDQLFLDWNITVIEQFEKDIEELINRIENHNYICPKSKVKNLYKCKINKHNSLIYRIKIDKTIEVIILLFNKSLHEF